MSISRDLFKGTLQLATARWLVRAMGLISTVVLARLLVPEDFGLVAVVTAFYGFLEIFSAFGIPQALIRERENACELYGTAFTVYALRGTILALLGVAGAFAVPEFVQDPRLPMALLVMSLRPIIDGLSNPRLVELERALNFRAITIRQIGGKIIGVLISVSIAISTNSYWSMIVGLLSASLFETIAGYILLPWMPVFKLSGWRRLLALSGWASAANIFTSIGQRMDNLIIAGFLDLKTTGIYNVGKEISSMPLGEVVSPMARTLFPGLLRFADNRAKLAENSLQVLGALATCSFAIGCGFAFVGSDVIHLLYGPAWSQASIIVPYVSVSLALETATSVAGSLALAVGEMRLIFMRAFSRTLIRLPIFVVGAAYWGLEGAAIGFAAGAVVTAVANLGIFIRILKVSWFAVFQEMYRPALASVVMVLSLVILKSAMPPATTELWRSVMLFVDIIFGGFVYSVAIVSSWIVVGRPPGLESKVIGSFSPAFRWRVRTNGKG